MAKLDVRRYQGMNTYEREKKCAHAGQVHVVLRGQ